MKLREQKGFTLIEVIVVAGIIAVLAGILVPLIFKEIDESKISRAAADVRSISTALIVLKKDTGNWPVTSVCNNAMTLMKGDGSLPTFSGGGWVINSMGSFDSVLNADDSGCWPNTWKGPYMATVNKDPWGNSYLMNVDALLSTATPLPPVWIISAGPDGILQTAATDTTIANDSGDVGLRLR
ncbi:MAG: type II secretion system protein GspG [Nitrospirae bacterium]|nr:type II secretion system protein GspG [Nitrospirota bacterium]